MSGHLLAVLPILDARYGNECLRSILAPDSAAGFDPDDVLVVDNTRTGYARETAPLGAEDCICLAELVYEHGEACPLYHHHLPEGPRLYRDPDGHNLGVARSWNVGIRESMRLGLDYTVLVSASMRFGPILHTTFVRQMETFWGANVIECEGHSWHLIAIHRRVFEAVGLFDENFYPAHEESIDFGYRMRLVGMEGKSWANVWVNALSAGAAWHARMVSCPNEPLRDYYATKWGGQKGEEQFTFPFGEFDDLDRPRTLDYWPERSIPELAKKYGLEVWW